MAENKTMPTGASVADFLNAIPDDARRADCRAIAELMGRATGAEAEMWGANIVGFGRYHYRYASGREGDWFLVGFSPRKQNLTIYLSSGFERFGALLERLGKHTTSTGACIYVKRLSDLDLPVLRELVERCVAHLRSEHPVA